MVCMVCTHPCSPRLPIPAQAFCTCTTARAAWSSCRFLPIQTTPSLRDCNCMHLQHNRMTCSIEYPDAPERTGGAELHSPPHPRPCLHMICFSQVMLGVARKTGPRKIPENGPEIMACQQRAQQPLRGKNNNLGDQQGATTG